MMIKKLFLFQKKNCESFNIEVDWKWLFFRTKNFWGLKYYFWSQLTQSEIVLNLVEACEDLPICMKKRRFLKKTVPLVKYNPIWIFNRKFDPPDSIYLIFQGRRSQTDSSQYACESHNYTLKPVHTHSKLMDKTVYQKI
jgi:hypothetical protein